MSRLMLFEYQKKAVSFVQRVGRCILRLDTGLGKTAVCIAVAKQTPEITNVLVICPAFLKWNWLREIDLWGGYSGVGGNSIRWVVTSYTKAGKIHNSKTLGKEKWDIIICDEAHYLKNWDAKRTQNIIHNIIKKTKYVILSTATPFVRSAADYHPLFSVCEPGKWGRFGDFAERYCKKKPNMWKRWNKWEYYGVKEENADELRERSTRFMLTYRKRDVLKDLPEKIETDIEIELDAEFDLQEYEEYIDVDTGVIVGSEHLTTQTRELGIEKAQYAQKWYFDTDKREPVVIFCKHLDVLRELNNYFDDALVIHGGISNYDRQKVVEDFQTGEFDILLATIGSCGVGLNLTAASRCLFVELPWSYTELKQCADRLHRIGQKNCVHVNYLIAKDSIDELILGVLRRKVEGEELSIGGM